MHPPVLRHGPVQGSGRPTPLCSDCPAQAAFVEGLDGSFLFDSMYAEDVEGSKLAQLHGVGELLETYPQSQAAARGSTQARDTSLPGQVPSHSGPRSPSL